MLAPPATLADHGTVDELTQQPNVSIWSSAYRGAPRGLAPVRSVERNRDAEMAVMRKRAETNAAAKRAQIQAQEAQQAGSEKLRRMQWEEERSRWEAEELRVAQEDRQRRFQEEHLRAKLEAKIRLEDEADAERRRRAWEDDKLKKQEDHRRQRAQQAEETRKQIQLEAFQAAEGQRLAWEEAQRQESERLYCLQEQEAEERHWFQQEQIRQQEEARRAISEAKSSSAGGVLEETDLVDGLRMQLVCPGHPQQGKVGTLSVNKTNFLWSGQGPWRLRLDDGQLVAIADPSWVTLAPALLKKDFCPLGPQMRGAEAVFWAQSQRGAARMRRCPPRAEEPTVRPFLGDAVLGSLRQLLPRSLGRSEQPNRTLKKTEVLSPALQRRQKCQHGMQQRLQLQPAQSAPTLVTAVAVMQNRRRSH